MWEFVARARTTFDLLRFTVETRDDSRKQKATKARPGSHPLAKSIPPRLATSRPGDLCVTSHKYTCSPTKDPHNDSIEAERARRVRTKAGRKRERTAIRSKSAPFIRPSVSSSIRELSVKPL